MEDMTDLVEEGGIREGSPPVLSSPCACGQRNCRMARYFLQPKALKEEEEKQEKQGKGNGMFQRIKKFFVFGKKKKEEISREEESDLGEDGAHRFVKANKMFFRGYRLFGVVNMRDKDGRYVVSEVRFIISYVLWMTWPLVILASFHTRQNEVVSGPAMFIGGWMATFFLSVVPSLQAYSLKFINMCVPDFLEGVTTLCNIQVDFKTPLKFSKKNFLRDLVSMDNQRGNLDKKSSYPEKLFHWLPVVMVVTTFTVLCVIWALGYLKYLDSTDIMSDLPDLAYFNIVQVFPLMTTGFINGLVRWFTTVYHKLCKHFRDKKEWSRQELLANLRYMEQLQKMFELVSEGFFRYTLTVNLLCITIGAVLCTATIFRDSKYLVYLEPDVLYVLSLGAICSGCSDLMDKYEEWLKLLQKACKEHRVTEGGTDGHEEWLILTENLHQHPPQVVTFGGYRANRGLLVSLLGFILSYAVLVNQIAFRHTGVDPEECAAAMLRTLMNATRPDGGCRPV